MTAIAGLVSAGQSVAVVTGYAAAASQEQRGVQKATRQMRPCEGRVWAWFEGGCILLDVLDD